MSKSEPVTIYLKVSAPPEEDDFRPVLELEKVDTFGTFGHARGGFLLPILPDQELLCRDCTEDEGNFDLCDGHILEDSIRSCGVYDFVEELTKEVKEAIYQVSPPARIRIVLQEWITEYHSEAGHVCDTGYSNITYEVIPIEVGPL